jgi:hypothetical protein
MERDPRFLLTGRLGKKLLGPGEKHPSQRPGPIQPIRTVYAIGSAFMDSLHKGSQTSGYTHFSGLLTTSVSTSK